MKLRIPALTALIGLALTEGCGGETGAASTDAGESETSGGEDTQICADPGSPLYGPEGPPVFEVPQMTAAAGACSTGWASDPPRKVADWTLELDRYEEQPPSVLVEAHPGGGVVVAMDGRLRRYDAAGALLWLELADDPFYWASLQLAVGEDGTSYWGYANLDLGQLIVQRWDEAGQPLAPLVVPDRMPLQDAYVSVLASGASVWLAASIDEQGVAKVSLTRLSSSGEVELDMATDQLNYFDMIGQDGAGTVLAVNSNVIMIDGQSGGVIATIGTPTLANGLVGDPGPAGGWYQVGWIGGTGGDFGIERYDGAGAMLWARAHDRVGRTENGSGVAPLPEGGVVMAGYESLAAAEPGAAYDDDSQPWLVAVDDQGGVLWGDRIAVVGGCRDVAVSDQGVYVVGSAQKESGQTGNGDGRSMWLRRYAL